MRKIQLVIAIALMGIAVLAGCSSGSSSSSASPSYFMKATAGATTMNATTCVAALVGTTMGISGSTVTGGVGGPPQINISITNWTGAAGNTAIGSAGTTNTFAEYTPAASLTSLSQSGSVTISSVSSTTISGSFNFTCTDGTIISAGTFTAKRY